MPRALIKETMLTFFIALVIFLPITGFILKGYDYKLALHRPLLLAFVVACGRLLLSLWRGRTARTGGWLAGVKQRIAAPLQLLTVRQRQLFYALPCVLLLMPLMINEYWLTVLISVFIYVLLGLGLNIVVGLAGLLDLGFVAFYAVGAYSYALGVQYLGLGFWTALPFAMALATCCGVLLGFPVLRMHGDYLAIVTLGFGEIIRLVLNNWLEFTGGPNGVQVPAPTFFGLEFAPTATQGGQPLHEFLGIDYEIAYRYTFIYLLLLLVVCGTVFFVNRLKKMPLGRSWEALREDEIACRSLGLNHVTIKLSAFSMGAMIGGMAGVFFAAWQGFINPTSFSFFESALILCIVVLGGGGSTGGVIAAAVVITLLPEILREFSDFRVILFGGLMVVMMIWKPRGFVVAKRQQFERSD